MVGGGTKRDDGAIGISSTNVFAALETLKKKKKSTDKHQKGSPKRQGSSMAQTRELEPPKITWVPTPLNKSWADVDDDDDDEYFKNAPVLPVWRSAQTQDNKDSMAHSVEEDSESEEDDLLEGDYDVEEDEAEQEPESSVPVEPISIALKDPERQLSKKELKKKELEELDALLAEFRVSNKEENGAEPVENNVAANEDGKENASAQANTKATKKKKVKKEKSSNQAINASNEAVADELKKDSASSEVDIKEKLKKIASKKKKSSKDTDAPSKAAAMEAAARSAKLVAARKKEKSHYNQQPWGGGDEEKMAEEVRPVDGGKAAYHAGQRVAGKDDSLKLHLIEERNEVIS